MRLTIEVEAGSEGVSVTGQLIVNDDWTLCTHYVDPEGKDVGAQVQKVYNRLTSDLLRTII